jgi:CheY-like chemotaxis protein
VSPDLPRGHETILLVEDESSVRELATAMLKRQGYHVLTAANGDDALALAAQRPGHIDLLLTDVVMPGMNGRELSERLLQLRPGLAVLFASGYTEDTILRHGVLSETTHFLAKPYTLPAIANKVRQVLDAKPAAAPGAPRSAG